MRLGRIVGNRMQTEPTHRCNLVEQGWETGSCQVEADGDTAPACHTTLRYKDGAWERLITSVHLSRPENYLSVYQSGLFQD